MYVVQLLSSLQGYWVKGVASGKGTYLASLVKSDKSSGYKHLSIIELNTTTTVALCLRIQNKMKTEKQLWGKMVNIAGVAVSSWTPASKFRIPRLLTWMGWAKLLWVIKWLSVIFNLSYRKFQRFRTTSASFNNLKVIAISSSYLCLDGMGWRLSITEKCRHVTKIGTRRHEMPRIHICQTTVSSIFNNDTVPPS